MTCESLHRYEKIEAPDMTAVDRFSPEIIYMTQFIPKTPVTYCPTLFGRKGDRQRNRDMRINLGNTLRGYRAAIETVVNEMQKKEPTGIYIDRIDETRTLVFQEEEIADDCFHLSVKGQFKVAKTVLEAIRLRVASRI